LCYNIYKEVDTRVRIGLIHRMKGKLS